MRSYTFSLSFGIAFESINVTRKNDFANWKNKCQKTCDSDLEKVVQNESDS